MENVIAPIRITDNDLGVTYELDFSRESIKFMANNNFVIDEGMISRIAKDGPELWYYAFRKNHRKIARNQTDALYEKMGGLAPKLIERLVDLYNQALMSNNIVQDDEELDANPHVTVEL